MSLVLALIFLALIVISVATDLHRMIIPNWLNASVALLFLPAAFVAGFTWTEIGVHVGAGAIAFAVCMALFYGGIFGGGDAKLIPGVVMWTGMAGLMPFLFWMALAGGVLGVVLLAARRIVNAGNIMILQKSSGVPYAVAIAVGVVAAVPASRLLVPVAALF